VENEYRSYEVRNCTKVKNNYYKSAYVVSEDCSDNSEPTTNYDIVTITNHKEFKQMIVIIKVFINLIEVIMQNKIDNY